MTRPSDTATPDSQEENDRRTEPRFPCVGIGLLYSPTQKGCVDTVSQDFFTAIAHDISKSGMAFDVDQPLAPGDKLYILITQQNRPTERLCAEVRWCQPMSEHSFRIGTRILTSEGVIEDDNRTASIPIQQGPPIPSSVEFICPACGQHATFTYAAQQTGEWGSGLMPLYDCSNCGTTRTITTILAHTQALAKSDKE